jgi:catechol 2,3-dioxygenase-like lactoylglutathione lyase family enzyme
MGFVRELAFVRYVAPDLDEMEAFLTDFGLHRAVRTEGALYMRASGTAPFVHVTELGPQPRAAGFGLLAVDAAALEGAANRFGATVKDSPEPGGGRRIRLLDPSGFIVDVVHGQRPAEPLGSRPPVPSNPYVGRARRGSPVRFRPAPSNIKRVGHVALLVSDMAASAEFYGKLGLRPSDHYFAGAPENAVGSFLACDLGPEYTDHHTVAIVSSQGAPPRFDHTAFEVIDLDDLMQGNAYLHTRGRRHSWGVGRHIEGSQLFDYWRDPWGHKVEHWTDGDLVNAATPVGRAPLGPNALAQWGPPLSPEFLT